MSRWLLIGVIVAIAGFLAAMSVLIVILKIAREVRAARLASWRRKLEPGIRRYIGISEGQAAPEPRRALSHFVTVPDVGLGREAAIASLLEHSEVVKGEALERITAALEQIGMVDEEIGRLSSRSWWRRASAAEKLGLARSQRAVEPLAKRLDDPDHEVRLRAARSLGLIGGHSAVRPLVAALAEPTRWSVLRVGEILATMGSRVEQELLVAYDRMPLKSRVATIDILGRLRLPGSASFLEQRLRDEDPDIRARAAHALGQIADPTTHRSLIESFHDPEWPVRAMAAKALGRQHVPEAAPVLVQGLRDREWWVRSNSAESLLELGEAGTRALLGALDDQDTFARHQAVLMLEQNGSVDRLAENLLHEDGEAAGARGLLLKLIDIGQVGRIGEIASTHPDAAVRAALTGLLKSGGFGQEGARG